MSLFMKLNSRLILDQFFCHSGPVLTPFSGIEDADKGAGGPRLAFDSYFQGCTVRVQSVWRLFSRCVSVL